MSDDNLSKEEFEKRMQMIKENCIFCKIVSEEVPSYKIFEDDICIAILDINPASKGHLLLIPKEHYMILPMVPDEVFGHLGVISKLLSDLLMETFNPESVEIFIANGPAAGQQSQHFMMHLIPLYEAEKPIQINNLDSSESLYSDDELKELVGKLKVSLSQIGR